MLFTIKRMKKNILATGSHQHNRIAIGCLMTALLTYGVLYDSSKTMAKTRLGLWLVKEQFSAGDFAEPNVLA